MVTDKEKSIFLGNSGVTVINVLESLAQGMTHEAILRAHPDLTYNDIMAAAKTAIQLLNDHIIIDDRVVANGQVKLVLAGRKLMDLETMRKKHPRAYEPWTDDEQNRLVSMFKAGESKSEISRVLGRQTGAVVARLERLGLVDRKGEAKSE